ncbi:MAG: hypothetical protein KU38_07050 [Sulfurovum sp. FS08-3]|nr:MAG: hypothetical protein KU38_07050 [Sulfurovum sp. FS08-3]
MLKIITKIMTTLSGSLLLLGCTNEIQKVPMPNELIGVWQQQGYGKVVQINSDGFTLYDITKMSCIKDITGDKNKWDEFVVSTYFEGDVLHLVHSDSKKYQFDKIAKLPPICDKEVPNTPSNNFEVLWNTFDENYAFFDTRNIDWKMQYNQYKPMIYDSMSIEEWFKVVSNMIEPLQDVHVVLSNDSNTLTYQNRVLSPFLEDILQYCQTKIDVNSCAGSELNNLLNITYNYIENPKRTLNDNLTYGIVKNNPSIAYFNLIAMSGYDKGNSEKYNDQIALIDKFMDNWLKSNSHIDTLIFDVRFNGGGYDENSIEWANWLVNESKIIMAKEAKWGNGFTKSTQIHTQPKANAFQGKIIVLTSKMSASATEIFLLALKPYDKATLIGEQTQGVFSDALLKKLPNGFNFSLSNEVYRDSSNIIYEAQGVPVDVEMQNYTKEEIIKQQDLVLERAIAIAKH